MTRRPAPPRPHPGPDDGRILLLTLGYLAVLVALVLVVTAATAVHLQRKRLIDLADLTALAAADATTPDDYLAAGATGVVLTDARVHAAATDHLAGAPEAARFAAVELVAATTPDGRTAVVHLRAVIEVPFAVVAVDALTVDAVARARAGP